MEEAEEFNEELAAIDATIADATSLIRPTEEHLRMVRDSRSRGSLKFVSDQTASLSALLSMRLGAIKAKAAIKNNKQNNKYKQITLGIAEKAAVPFVEIMEMLRDEGVNYRKSVIGAEEYEVIATEPALAATDTAFDNGDSSTRIEPLGEDPFPQTDLVCDQNGNLYLIDLMNSTMENTVLLNLQENGYPEGAKAEISMDENSDAIASYNGERIEIVEISA